MSAGFATGWFGKIPSTGDFITRRLPVPFRDTWDQWLQQALEGSRERLGAGWDERYQAMPPWRFLLSPGMAGAEAWAGVLLPSVDAVGRRFPLTLASALPAQALNLAATLQAAAAWFEAIEGVALDALELRRDVAAVDAAVAAQPFPAAALRPRDEAADGTVPLRRAGSIWLAEDATLPCESLPSVAQFCGMMDARWREHGWNELPRRDAEAA